MAKVHVGAQGAQNVYNCVVHANVPAGNNSAGIAWSAAIVAAGLNNTVMATGNGVFQITTTEANAIAGGTVIEAQFVWEDDPTMTLSARNANLDNAATVAVNALLARLAEQLKLFGYTRT